jgi:hypothetical protein
MQKRAAAGRASSLIFSPATEAGIVFRVLDCKIDVARTLDAQVEIDADMAKRIDE